MCIYEQKHHFFLMAVLCCGTLSPWKNID